MPKTGYKTVTVSLGTYEALRDFANETHRSIPQTIDFLAEKLKNQQKKEVEG